MSPTPAEVVDLGLAVLGRHDRPDLTARLRRARTRLVDGRVRVLVVGEFKQGKSQLVNGLAGAPVCPVSDDIATAVPTVVHHSEAVTVTLVRRVPPVAGDALPVAAVLDGGPDPDAGPELERVEVPAEELAGHLTGTAEGADLLDHVEVGVPRPVLAGGLELVDTPGVGGLSSVHGAATTATLPTADAVLLVSDASQEYTAPELDFLARAVAVCPNVACVLTKNDLYPQWRRIADLDRAHLQRAGITAPLFAVSSTLRWEAVLANDTELNEESGFPELVRYLRRDVLGQADRLARRSVAHDVLAVSGQLIGGLRAELTAQEDPEAARALVERLAEARARANELKDRSARWQQTLGDGVADLNADIDHDLRGRMREITRVAEEEISAGDPSTTWEQFTRWAHQEVAAAAAANFVWATQRTRWLGERVAEHFSADRDQLLPALRAEPSDALSSARPIAMRAEETFGVGQKALTGMRGGYMGMLMFGMLGTFVGFASLLNPLGVGAGLFMAGKSIRDERKRIVTKRQNEARAAVRRFVDDVTFQVAKESRDRLRGVQRDLRDHFTAQAEQMKRSLAESQLAAERAVKASQGERERRIPEIRAELQRLEALRAAARALVPTPKPSPAPAPAPVPAPTASGADR
ncbi:dynamin family protein [Pseudonocardia humida]|uniref:Dynamin family protein n=1 Tax=Pseudonocardia humida TaxID=2800819 RepID=A0ABT1ADM6_9PSEU|nr:dynamin family protein [Pseudonocardia humida]MCO1661171.1 dynamin family protein [Pseudonocardia humida]